MGSSVDFTQIKDLAEKMKALRCRMGWCQSDLARRLGVTAETVQAWEAGQSRPLDATMRVLDDLFHQAAMTQMNIED
jgi:DNA-binding transcriptional regulator YiaG